MPPRAVDHRTRLCGIRAWKSLWNASSTGMDERRQQLNIYYINLISVESSKCKYKGIIRASHRIWSDKVKYLKNAKSMGNPIIFKKTPKISKTPKHETVNGMGLAPQYNTSAPISLLLLYLFRLNLNLWSYNEVWLVYGRQTPRTRICMVGLVK